MPHQSCCSGAQMLRATAATYFDNHAKCIPDVKAAAPPGFRS